jgi:uncharacterized protein YqiB (DUF1249 family)
MKNTEKLEIPNFIGDWLGHPNARGDDEIERRR